MFSLSFQFFIGIENIIFFSDFNWKQLPMILDIKGQVAVALEF